VMFQKLLDREASSHFTNWLARMTNENPEERFVTARAARAALLGEKTSEALLQPFLIDSVPWARGRETWQEVRTLLSSGSSPRIALDGEIKELEPFAVSIQASLITAGVDVKVVHSEDEIDPTWPKGAAVLFLGGKHPEFGPWKKFSLEFYRFNELQVLIEALHPELHLERSLLSELHRATKGSPPVIRTVLEKVLSSHPTVEQFRQRLLSELATGAASQFETDPKPPTADPSFLILAWAKKPLPLEWYFENQGLLSDWAKNGWVRFLEKEGTSFVEATGPWNVDIADLAQEALPWFKNQLHTSLSPSPALSELLANLCLRANLREEAWLFGKGILRSSLRRRRFEKALVWLDQLDPCVPDPIRAQMERLRIRLLLEVGRLADAKLRIRSFPSSRAKEKFADRLAFLEGRYADCIPTPEVLTRLGRHSEAYASAIQRLSRPDLHRRRQAELERIAGLAAYYDDKTETAITHLRKACSLWRELKDIHGYIPSLNQLGMALARKGKLKQAARAYRHAASLADQSGQRRQHVSYLLNLATVQLETGNMVSALKNYESGLTTCRQLGLRVEETSIAQNLANIWLRAGNLSRASRLLSESDAWVATSGPMNLQLYQRILKADLALVQEEKSNFLKLVDELMSELPQAGRLASAIRTLASQAEFLRGNLGRAIEILDQSGATRLHQQWLRSEWEWELRKVTPDIMETRYQKTCSSSPNRSDDDFFSTLTRLRFLGLLTRASALAEHSLPEDLRVETKGLRKNLEENSPPELWGPLQKQLTSWFGEKGETPTERPSRTSGGSLSSLGNEGRVAINMLLEIVRQITSQRSTETLLRTILKEMMRLAEVPRGGIVAKRADTLESLLFLGEKWEKESGLPIDVSRSIIKSAIDTGKRVFLKDAREAAEREEFGASLRTHHLRGVLCLPLRAEGKITGALYLADPDQPLRLAEEKIQILQGVADHAAIVMSTAGLLEQLQSEQARVNELNRKLEALTLRLKQKVAHLEEMRTPYGTGRWEEFGIVGTSPKIRHVMETAERAAAGASRILIVGESGTEKEAVARAIVAMSDRSEEPFLATDCAAMPEQLLESELFGYESGAFTGATQSQPGIIRNAGKGTILLTSIDALTPAMQVKLLRLLQENTVRPLGSTREYPVEARFLATLDQNPQDLIQQGKLREDFYFRLAVFELVLPPLRERLEDLPYLVRQWLAEAARREGRPPKRVTRAVLKRLAAHSWPGNLRELANEMERASLSTTDDLIDIDDLSENLRSLLTDTRPLPTKRKKAFPKLRGQIERRILVHALKEAQGNYRVATERLNISLATLYRKLKKYGITS
ncbi:MAG TPA: sigma 54-interacting transcriptional regulator, partial [Bdellovibrionota bacterium]|nr:sigma 54-interacting transcriptional regulator [Bdellovibrionota bacterium]